MSTLTITVENDNSAARYVRVDGTQLGFVQRITVTTEGIEVVFPVADQLGEAAESHVQKNIELLQRFVGLTVIRG